VFTIRALAESLSDARLRGEISERSERIRIEQAEVAELVAVLAERERRAAAEAGRSAAAMHKGVMVEVQRLAGVTKREARGLIDVGAVLTGSTAAPAPWMHGVADAARDGSVSITKASVIQLGLGEPNERVSAEDLVLVTQQLVGVAPGLTPEQLEAETRSMREQLDHAHVRDEELRIQEKRSVKLYKHRDGSSTGVFQFDREATVIVSELLDNATGPRRSGPRFVSDEGKAYQQAIKDDPRRTEQLAHDVILAVLKLGLAANPNKLPGRSPAVRILVTEHDLKARTGYAELEGKGHTVSLETVDRHICDSGYLEILVDDRGKPLNHGTEKRLFTEAQRTALAIRDGGCRRATCESPASWAEAHHLEHWIDGGPTDLSNGILLCKTDHLELHNTNSWIEYEHDRNMYVWCSPDGSRTDMPSKARIQERIPAAFAVAD
jgi:hypothetical protein